MRVTPVTVHYVDQLQHLCHDLNQEAASRQRGVRISEIEAHSRALGAGTHLFVMRVVLTGMCLLLESLRLELVVALRVAAGRVRNNAFASGNVPVRLGWNVVHH